MNMYTIFVNFIVIDIKIKIKNLYIYLFLYKNNVSNKP